MLKWCQHRHVRLRGSRVHVAGVRTSPPRSRRDGEAEQCQAPRPGLSFATISGAHHDPSKTAQSWCDRGVRRHSGTGPGHHSYIGGGMNNMPRETGRSLRPTSSIGGRQGVDTESWPFGAGRLQLHDDAAVLVSRQRRRQRFEAHSLTLKVPMVTVACPWLPA